MREINYEVVHKKPVIFSLDKRKAGNDIVNHLKIILQFLAVITTQNTPRRTTEMVLRHLVPVKTKISYVSLIAKTISVKMSQRKRKDIQNLFTAVKVLQSIFSKTMTEAEEKQMKQCTWTTGTGEISSVIRFTAELVSRVVLLSERQNVLKVKQPSPSPSIAKHISNLSDCSVPYHPTFSEQINVSHIEEAVIKSHGSHEPSGLEKNGWRI